MLSALLCSYTSGDASESDLDSTGSRTELDTHANMPVVGKHVLAIEDLGITVDVTPFTPDYPAMQAKMVDAAI